MIRDIHLQNYVSLFYVSFQKSFKMSKLREILKYQVSENSMSHTESLR